MNSSYIFKSQNLLTWLAREAYRGSFYVQELLLFSIIFGLFLPVHFLKNIHVWRSKSTKSVAVVNDRFSCEVVRRRFITV